MDRYIVFDRNIKPQMFFCDKRNNTLNYGEKLCDNVEKLHSLSFVDEETLCACYENRNGEFLISIIKNGEIQGSRILFKNNSILQTGVFCIQNELKVFMAENNGKENNLKLMTISQSKPSVETICSNAVEHKEKYFKLFSFRNTYICTFFDDKGLSIFDCMAERYYCVNENNILDYSVSFDGRQIMCLCILKKGVRLYIFNANGEKDDLDVFKGSTANECFLFSYKNIVFACAADGENIFFRKIESNTKKIFPMGKLPIDNRCEKMMAVSFNKDFCCCETMLTQYAFDFMLNFGSEMKMEPKKIEAQQEKQPDKNVMVETLSKNIAQMSSENNLLNLRFKAVQDKYISQINELKESEASLKKELEKLEEANKELKDENEKVKNENNVLKKAKKLLEDEIYRLNNIEEENISNDIEEENR